MLDESLAFTPAFELEKLVRNKKVSPVELVELFLSRIERLNPELNAYLYIAAEEARNSAKVAERAIMEGEELPPLHGVPLSVKDLHYVKGMPCTGGSLVYKDFIPDADCVAVERLRRAGAIILGKTNTPEFGVSATTENRLGDHCRNPWNKECTSGGSSGGAAASVASGLGPLALGSDGGGSIRIPASFCGVYGLKPSYGRVPLWGGHVAMPLFANIGPISRTVLDAALMLSIMAGFDPRDPSSLRERPPDFLTVTKGELSNLRIAWSPDLGYAIVAQEVSSLVGAAVRVFESLGCYVEEMTPSIELPFPIFDPIMLADQYAAMGHLLEEHANKLMSYTKSILEHGRDIPVHQYSKALRALERFRMHMDDLFQNYHLLLTPTCAVPAFPVGRRPREIEGRPVSPIWGAFPFTAPFNLTGQPAATIPCGFSADGLPIGLQIIGRRGDEITVLRASMVFEQAQPWADKKPPLA